MMWVQWRQRGIDTRPSSPLESYFKGQGKPEGRTMTRSAFDPHLPVVLLYDGPGDG